MFARLTGRIDDIMGTTVIVDVGGVGYLVSCSGATRAALPGVGESVRLYIETHVREDAINLYGFINRTEQEWFRLLLTVQGVGARVALNILSACTPDRLALALMSQDKSIVSAADGVGPKLATRILTELKDKVPPTSDFSVSKTVMGNETVRQSTNAKTIKSEVSSSHNHETDIGADVISALVNLGYTRADAFSAWMRVRDAADVVAGDVSVGDYIRLALTELSKGVAA